MLFDREHQIISHLQKKMKIFDLSIRNINYSVINI